MAFYPHRRLTAGMLWAVAGCLWLISLAQIDAADVKLNLEHALSGSAFSKAGTISGTISPSVGSSIPLL